MPPAPLPENEVARLAVLRDMHLLDTPPNRAFDHLVKGAATTLNVPIALITLIDSTRQFFLSRFGVAITETPRAASFCAWAILDDHPTVVPDTTCDPRMSDNPLVTGKPWIRFYVGVPLRAPGGYALGTLCTLDYAPRQVTAAELQRLDRIAHVVSGQLAVRHRIHAMNDETMSSWDHAVPRPSATA